MRTMKELSGRRYAVAQMTRNLDQPILLCEKLAMLNGNGALAVGNSGSTFANERLSELYGTELHLVFANEADRVSCVSSKLQKRVSVPGGT